MTRVPSSTSSSDPGSAPVNDGGERRHPSRWRTIAGYAVGALVVIVTFDVAVAALFSIPEGQTQPKGRFAQYFSYGESVEGKLERTVGRDGEAPTPIIMTGWVPTELYPPTPGWANSQQPKVMLYGMSFTNLIGDAMRELDPTIPVLTRAGPSAALSHSYAIYEADPYRTQADHLVVGVLSSSVPYLQAINGLAFTPESPAPYTFPRFEWDGRTLHRFDPVITGRDAFVEAFRAESPLWHEHLDRLREQDAYWDEFVYAASVLDRSAFLKLLRRSWASRVQRQATAGVYDRKYGYDIEHPAMAALPVLLANMHQRCLADGQRFTVILLHARGEPGHLGRWLGTHLRGLGIDVISTADLFPSTDGQNFQPDSHYIDRRTRDIADILLHRIRAAQAEAAAEPGS